MTLQQGLLFASQARGRSPCGPPLQAPVFLELRAGDRRPPEANRFKKGVSGNPQGRPRMSRDLRADICDELAEPIEVKDESGRVLAISKQRALVKALVRKALSGDIRAATTLFSL